jgi:hypothetical protein
MSAKAIGRKIEKKVLRSLHAGMKHNNVCMLKTKCLPALRDSHLSKSLLSQLIGEDASRRCFSMNEKEMLQALAIQCPSPAQQLSLVGVGAVALNRGNLRPDIVWLAKDTHW